MAKVKSLRLIYHFKYDYILLLIYIHIYVLQKVEIVIFQSGSKCYKFISRRLVLECYKRLLKKWNEKNIFRLISLSFFPNSELSNLFQIVLITLHTIMLKFKKKCFKLFWTCSILIKFSGFYLMYTTWNNWIKRNFNCVKAIFFEI